MITFVKKAGPKPVPHESETNRFDQIRKAAKEGHRKSDSDRRARQMPRTTG